ncbi:hypothetical protein CHH26_05110 [Qipengyuania flava]|uniref:Lar family restriction alleviation protein n=1 Tax=Qipengyuania flava TaxID=192812 RepID=UPI000B8C0A76|nr:Lar family restriction alleviation protein [Qipengyuania flava]ASP29680.1 hypothetical protein CHH26_05110 [Qipengyuania flava]
MSEELKPCLWCNGSNAFVERADLSSCYVVCNDCGAKGPTSCNENDEDCAAEDAGMEPGESAARRLWNTRPAPKADGLVEELEALLRAAHSDDCVDQAAACDDLATFLWNKGYSVLAALKDRDVVLEEAAKICAVMAEDYITGQSKLGEKMPRNAAIAGILQSAEANILALRERV